MDMKIHTGKVGDFHLRKVPEKQVGRAGVNLALGYTFLPFVKIKSLSKRRLNNNGKNIAF